jgi:amidohydrolase
LRDGLTKIALDQTIPMKIVQRIKELAEAGKEECISWRRYLHAHPELSFHEVETASYIKKELQSFGLDNISTIGDTGVLLILEGSRKGKTILLRSDIDALPIQEHSSASYQSKVPGVMHACGHDAHTAMLLLATRILLELKDEWEGIIKILFQPAEEVIPGGALKMISAGILENPKIECAIGQHVFPALPTGKVGIRPGKFMASSDNFFITIHGKGGHAAMPETLIDPVVIAGHIIVALQQLVSRHRSPKIPSVLSIGRVIAPGSNNVIPDEVTLDGTFRTLDNEWRERALGLLTKLVKEMCESMGATCTVDIARGYPYLHNDENLAPSIKKSMEEYVGADNVVGMDIWMAAEDFAHYSHRVPSIFYVVGVGNEVKKTTSGLHTPTFDIDENVLPLGAGLMAWLALRQLE